MLIAVFSPGSKIIEHIEHLSKAAPHAEEGEGEEGNMLEASSWAVRGWSFLEKELISANCDFNWCLDVFGAYTMCTHTGSDLAKTKT